MKRVLLAVTLLLATSASASSISIAEYIQRLEGIETRLAAKDFATAKSEASLLSPLQVSWAKGTFRADASLLDAIAQSPQGAHRARLLLTINELRSAHGMDTAKSNRRLLEQIAADQESPPLPAGGEIKVAPDADVPFFERIATSIGDMFRWIGKKISKLLDWLSDLLPRRSGASAATPGLRWIVWVVVAAIVLLVIVLAVKVLRSSKRGETVVTASTPLGSTRDEDPLSRGATEWERYAGELAAAGQFREAIRAWYHAVLVTCYAAGILHFRKGRTNWEYVASLPPSLAWRPDLIELTRRFEKEWYGAEQSTAEALEECAERAERILDALRREMRGAA